MRGKTIRPITSTLIGRTLKWSLLCTLAFGGLQAWLAYQSVQNDFQTTVRQVAGTHVPLLSLAIWDIEPLAIQQQIDFLLETPQIGYVLVSVGTSQQFEGGNPSIREHGTKLSFNLPPPGRNAGTIGTLDVVMDMQVLYQKLVRSVALVLLEFAVLTALILGSVVTILRRDLERPMRRLADFVTNLHADKLDMHLQLERPPGHSYDEIDLVADGFLILQENVQRHIATLDSKVQERTQELETALASLKTLSAIDPLTGCFNRLLFNERLPGEISRVQRYGHPLSIVFCDIDHFKSVNDNHGHLAGDQLLVAVGACLRRGLRADVDWVARYGGEEFVAVLPETALAAALEVAERLRQDVAQRVRVELADHTVLQVTASFGVAQFQQESVEALLQRADEQLYAAKAAGRNLVRP